MCEVAGTPRYENGLGIANWRDGFCCAPPRPQRGTSPRATFPLSTPWTPAFAGVTKWGADSAAADHFRTQIAGHALYCASHLL